MTDDQGTALRQHVFHSREYLENALIALQNSEAGKAGELLWGSVAQAVHAAALNRNYSIRSHRDLKNFVIRTARELQDDDLLRDFNSAESLHRNFYVIEDQPSDIELFVPTVRELVDKLLELIPPDELRESRNL